MAILIMILGVLATVFFHVDKYGVTLLSAVEPGLPHFCSPAVQEVDLTHAAGRGLMIAVVVMAETLLAENNFAVKNGYKLDIRQEILACAAGNLAAAAVGAVRRTESISRTSMNEQYGGKTQGVSVVAAIVMAVILLTATGFYRISAGAGARHRDLRAPERGGDPSGDPAFQTQQIRVLYLPGCRDRGALPGHDLRCADRHRPVLRGDDAEGDEPAAGAQGYGAGEAGIL